MCNFLGVFRPFGPRVGGLYVSSCLHWYCIYHANNWRICVICWVSQLVRAKTWCPCSAMVWLEVKILRKISIIFLKKKYLKFVLTSFHISLYGVKLAPVSNWSRCQIDSFALLVSNWSGVKLVPVSNWLLYTLGVKLVLVSNWLFYTLGVKLSSPHSWCQIDSGVKLVPVSNCPPTQHDTGVTD